MRIVKICKDKVHFALRWPFTQYGANCGGANRTRLKPMTKLRRGEQMSQTKTIKPFEAYSRMPDGEVVTRGTAVVNKMSGNSDFQKPPVDLSGLQTDIDTFSALMAEALGGSKKVMAEKWKQREVVVNKLRLLGRYVEVMCNGDMAIFLSSGFVPVLNTKAQPQRLSQNIRRLDHGFNSGEVVIRLKAVSDAVSYQIRYAVSGNGDTAAEWMIQPAVGVRQPITLSGLKPAAKYAFQVRSLTKSGYTDWSESVTFICT
jgi:hypothetical protein